MFVTPRAGNGITPKGKAPKGKTPKHETISTPRATPKGKTPKHETISTPGATPKGKTPKHKTISTPGATPKVKLEKTLTSLKNEIEQDTSKSAKKSSFKLETPTPLKKEIEQNTPKCSPKSAKKRPLKLVSEDTPVKKLKASNGDVVSVKSSSVEEVSAYKVVRDKEDRIVVSNLPLETTITDIKKSFEKYADLYAITLSWQANPQTPGSNVNKEVAFVKYNTSLETRKALDVFGPNPELNSNHPSSLPCVFGILVKNVPNRCSRENIHDVFAECGSIEYVIKKPNEFLARVYFTTNEAAEKALALDGKRIGAHAIRVTLHKEDPTETDIRFSKLRLNKLNTDKNTGTDFRSLSVLLQIGKHINENDLRTTFGTCGAIKFVRIIANRGKPGKHAYIQYYNIESVEKAVKLSGSVIKGFAVAVARSNPRKESSEMNNVNAVQTNDDSTKMEVNDESDQDGENETENNEDSDEVENVEGVDEDEENGVNSDEDEDSDEVENVEGVDEDENEDESDEGSAENVQDDADSEEAEDDEESD